jgi:hypothetical protein
VHVHQGGQAIVGHVEGGGFKQNQTGQPHATLSDARKPSMRSEDSERLSLPVTGHAERPLPDVRR